MQAEKERTAQNVRSNLKVTIGIWEWLACPTKLQIKFIQFEEHCDDLYEDNEKKIKQFLMDNGFEFYHKVKHGFGEIYDVIYKNKVL